MNEEFFRIILFITTFGIVFLWTITSPFNVREWISHITSFNTRQLLVNSIGIIIILQLFDILTTPVIMNSKLIAILGLIINFAGFVMAAWAKVAMKSVWGPPAQHDIKRQNKLITRGPYALTRNPIYLGLLMMFAGMEMALRSYLILLVIPVYFLILKSISIEEKLLEKYFGKKYLDYKLRVPLFFPKTI